MWKIKGVKPLPHQAGQGRQSGADRKCQYQDGNISNWPGLAWGGWVRIWEKVDK